MSDLQLSHIFKEYWSLIVCVVSIIAMWFKMQNAIKNLEACDEKQAKQIERVEIGLKATDTTFLEIKTSLARVETSIEFIRQEIAKR